MTCDLCGKDRPIVGSFGSWGWCGECGREAEEIAKEWRLEEDASSNLHMP